MIVAEDLHVRLANKTILDGTTFLAAAGQVTAIVGPNGSGKTTLLRALTGEIASKGTLTLNGTDIRRARAWEMAAMRAVLPQATPLAFPFTVIEVVRLGLASGVSAAQVQLASQALARVDLQGYEGRLYQELSGGEQQRVQLARVMVQVWMPVLNGQPRWLLLDEPVSSLDIGHQLVVMQVVRDFADAGGGVVAVMHDLNLTAMFADKVALIANGTIRDQGTPEQVLTNANLSAAYRCNVRVRTPPSTGMWLLPHAASV